MPGFMNLTGNNRGQRSIRIGEKDFNGFWNLQTGSLKGTCWMLEDIRG